MPKVRVLVADDDLNMHQVIEDILGVCFKEVEVERVMSGAALMAKLRVHAASYDLLLLNLIFPQSSGTTILPQILAEFPALRNRLVVVVSADQETGMAPDSKELPRVCFPFLLDEFVETLRKVYEKSRDESAVGSG